MKPTAQPNVIIVITDDQGYGDLACHGNPVAQTPHLDALHNESVRLQDFHAAPMCTPTRGQLLTGLDACRNGAVNVSSGRTLLRADLQTLADLYRESGYRTGIFGKWHLGDNYPYRPQDRGFEESLWFPSSHINSLPDYFENDYFDDVYTRNGERQHYQGYCTEVFFREAKGWMAEQIGKAKPFFAYLPTNAPHAPLWVPEEDREAMEQVFREKGHLLPDMNAEIREAVIRFLAMIRNLDTEVGKLRAFLEEKGAAKDTLLIFMTDNGSTFGPQYFNAGMRGGKVTLWEGGHRVPCFLHWPSGGLGSPREVEGLTQVQDLLPTLIELCGLNPSANAPLDGISLAPVFRENREVPQERMIAVNYSRMPGFDYPSPDSQAVIRREGAAVLWKRWRYLEGTALYDLEKDPAQEENVIGRFPEIACKMEKKLDEWWAEVEPTANQVQRIIIGSEHENPAMLSACEWRDVFVDTQAQLREGVHRNSYWHLTVAQAGTYRFELRRWPKESGIPLASGCSATRVTDGFLSEGVALPVARARMMIDRREFVQECGDGDEGARFEVELTEGDTLLHTWFDDERHQPICGAYYVYVEKITEAALPADG